MKLPSLPSLRRRASSEKLGAAEAHADDRQLVYSLSPSRIPTFAQLKHLPDVLRPREWSLMRLLATIASLSMFVLIGHFFAIHVRLVARAGGTLSEGLVGNPQYINPVLARPFSADHELTNLLFRGLTKVDDHLTVVPDLAQSITPSEEGRAYTVKLPKDAKWSDDEAITSADIKYTFETIADSDFKSPYLSLFQNVTIDTPDEQTAVFHLGKISPTFPSYLTMGLLPAHVWSDSTPQNFTLAEFNVRPVGNGPYKFSEFGKDRNGTIHYYTFVRNPNYTGPKPLMDKVTIRFYDTVESALEALHKNSIDAYGSIPISDRKKVSRDEPIKELLTSQLTGVFFNQRVNAALKAKEVRQALATAVDRDDLIKEALNNSGQPVFGPIPPKYPTYKADVKQYDFNIEQANKILEDAGWKKNDKGIRQKGSQWVTFTLTTPDEPTFVAVTEHLAKNWRDIGAQVEVKKIPSAQMPKDIIKPRAYEALVFSQIYDADPDPYAFWHSSQARDTGFNLSIFFNKKMDQDLEAGRSTIDQAKRQESYADFQNLFAEDVPAIMLYQSEFLYAHTKSLRGFTSDRIVTASDRFKQVDRWYLKTRLGWE